MRLSGDGMNCSTNSAVIKWWEPWYSGYGRRLMFQRSWVQIPAPYTRWTFSHLFVVKIVMCVWKDKNKWKRVQYWPILKQCNKNCPCLTLNMLTYYMRYYAKFFQILLQTMIKSTCVYFCICCKNIFNNEVIVEDNIFGA